MDENVMPCAGGELTRLLSSFLVYSYCRGVKDSSALRSCTCTCSRRLIGSAERALVGTDFGLPIHRKLYFTQAARKQQTPSMVVVRTIGKPLSPPLRATSAHAGKRPILFGRPVKFGGNCPLQRHRYVVVFIMLRRSTLIALSHALAVSVPSTDIESSASCKQGPERLAKITSKAPRQSLTVALESRPLGPTSS